MYCCPFQKRKQNKTKSEEGAVVKRVKSEPMSEEDTQCGSSSDIEDNKMVFTIILIPSLIYYIHVHVIN